MAKYSKTLQLIAVKLDISDDDKILRKAAEFERLLQMKSTSNITDTAKVVLCLDLAAEFYGNNVDMKTAIKCSGLKSPAYTNSRKVVQNLLELDCDKLTTSTLCVSLPCGVRELADKILEEYRKAKIEVDLQLPQYVCMAVYHACRINKAKVTKSKLVEKSRLKPSQWTKLDAEWTKFVDERFVAVKKSRERPKKIEENNNEDLLKEKLAPEEKESEHEPYETWKRRMLEDAHKELKKTKENKRDNDEELKVLEVRIKDNALRRSPRKTPQKFEPYSSPVKNKGVRLLFPAKM